MSGRRIVSLLPSTTEIVAALDSEVLVVARHRIERRNFLFALGDQYFQHLCFPPVL